jgi:glycyl-tRNA synthetase beta chain
MGKYYAINDGEDRRVAIAIEEQYLPRFLGDKVARTKIGISLSIADKVNTLVGFFGVGIKPSGSEDPFALRRNAIGIVHTILRNEINIGIRPIIEKASNLYTITLLKETASDVENFIKDRLKAILNQEGFSSDVIDAAINITDDILDIKFRVETLQSLKSEENFEDVMLTFRRVMNIIPENFKPVEEVKPTNEYEEELLSAFERVKDEIEKLSESRSYKEALLKIRELKPYVDRFFDNVLVMEKDEMIRNIRLSILKIISDTLLKLYDFRKIKPS